MNKNKFLFASFLLVVWFGIQRGSGDCQQVLEQYKKDAQNGKLPAMPKPVPGQLVFSEAQQRQLFAASSLMKNVSMDPVYGAIFKLPSDMQGLLTPLIYQVALQQAGPNACVLLLLATVKAIDEFVARGVDTLNSNTIRERAAVIFKAQNLKMFCPGGCASAFKARQIADISKQLHIADRLYIGPIKKVPSDKMLAHILNKKPVWYFILNNEPHWVLLTVVKKVDGSRLMYYIDTSNGLRKNNLDNAKGFIRYLSRVIAQWGG